MGSRSPAPRRRADLRRRSAARGFAERPFTALGAAILALIGIAHALRVFAGWQVVVVGVDVPVWLSGVVAVVFVALATMVWRESRL